MTPHLEPLAERRRRRAEAGIVSPSVAKQDRLFSPGAPTKRDLRSKTTRPKVDQGQLFTPQPCPACGGDRCGCPRGTKAMRLL